MYSRKEEGRQGVDLTDRLVGNKLAFIEGRHGNIRSREAYKLSNKSLTLYEKLRLLTVNFLVIPGK